MDRFRKLMAFSIAFPSTSPPPPPLNTTSTSTGNTSKSYFQKTVCLEEWWLIKAEKDYLGKTLAVAGFTSRQQRALRVFYSAPILKRTGVFTLETSDGICVVIKGFINKARTEENGFPSEVLNHFMIGFPPCWEKYAEKYLGDGYTTEEVARSNLDLGAGVRDSGEGTPKNNEKAFSEERRDDKENVGVEENEDMELGNGHLNLSQGACNESPVEAANVTSPVLSENMVDGTSKDFNLQNHEVALLSSAEEESRFITDSCVSDIDIESPGERFSSASKYEGHLSHAAVLVNNDAETSCKDLGEEKLNKKSSTTSVGFEEERENLEKTGSHYESRSLRLRSSKSKIKQNNDETTYVILNNDRSKPKSVSLDSSGEVKHAAAVVDIATGDGSVLNMSNPGRMLRPRLFKSKSQLEEDQITNGIVSNDRSKSNFASGGFSDEVKHDAADVEIAPGDGSNLNQSNARLKEPISEKTVKSLGARCEKDGYKHFRSFPSGTDPNQNQNHGDIIIQARKQKNTNEAIRSPIRLGAHNKKKFKTSVGKKTSISKAASTSSKKVKRKLTYGTPMIEKEKEGTSIVSPESFKRSRSGRLLLPTLEFWRNQRAIYDADRQVTGIKALLQENESSRGWRSYSLGKQKPTRKVT